LHGNITGTTYSISLAKEEIPDSMLINCMKTGMVKDFFPLMLENSVRRMDLSPSQDLAVMNSEREGRIWVIDLKNRVIRWTIECKCRDVKFLEDDSRLAILKSDVLLEYRLVPNPRHIKRYDIQLNHAVKLVKWPGQRKVGIIEYDDMLHFFDYENDKHLTTVRILREELTPGLLWTSPPDEFADSGWYYFGCDKQYLKDAHRLLVIHRSENLQTIGHALDLNDDEERSDYLEYLKIFNRKDMIIQRLNHYEQKYRQKINQLRARRDKALIEHSRNLQIS
jgi:hypothetical protein